MIFINSEQYLVHGQTYKREINYAWIIISNAYDILHLPYIQIYQFSGIDEGFLVDSLRFGQQIENVKDSLSLKIFYKVV